MQPGLAWRRYALVIEPSSIIWAQLREYLHRYSVATEEAESADHLAQSACLGRYYCTIVDEQASRHPRFLAKRGCGGSPLILLCRYFHVFRKTPCAARLRKPLEYSQVLNALASVARAHAQGAIGRCKSDCDTPALVPRLD